MKIRATNNSEIELDDVKAVFRLRTGYRVVFKDGSAKQYRPVQLTAEAHQLFEEAATS
jgi:hypothetical protein